MGYKQEASHHIKDVGAVASDKQQVVKNMDYKTQDKRYFVILAVLGIIFFFLYSFLPLVLGPIFNSPDANANYTFAKVFAERGEFKIFEPLNREAGDIVRPRSTNVFNPFIVPGSFLGMILLYGFLAKLFSVSLIPFLTPLFAAVGVLFFYGFIRNIFNVKIAFISALLLFIHPAFWYYSSRGLLHNVLFAVFLIIALYVFSKIREENKWFWYFLGGLFLGFALAVRTSEIIWIFIISVIIILAYCRRIKWRYVLLSIGAFAVALAPIFYYQYLTYGHPLNTGYTRLDSPLVKEALSGKNFGSFLPLLFPFGINFSNIKLNFYNYFLNLFPWFSWGLLGGIVVFLLHFFKWQKRHYLYLGSWLLASLWLFIYYGSWIFHDNPDPRQITIGTSYVRYWLPVFIFSLPLLGIFIAKIANISKNRAGRILIAGILIFLLAYPSAAIVVWRTDESLLKMRINLEHYQKIKANILAWTEDNAVIVSGSLDKILFPERRVIYDLVDEYNQQYLKAVVESAPVYFYSVLPKEAIDYLNARKLSRYNLELEEYKEFESGEKLMRVKFVD